MSEAVGPFYHTATSQSGGGQTLDWLVGHPQAATVRTFQTPVLYEKSYPVSRISFDSAGLLVI